MLEMRKTVVSLEAPDLMELEGIVMDSDEKAALRYLKKTIYDRVDREQQGRLKSHLDGGRAAEGFSQGNK